MVATFIGVLELLKSQRIRVQQARPFDDIWIEGQAPQDVSQVLQVEGEQATGLGEDAASDAIDSGEEAS